MTAPTTPPPSRLGRYSIVRRIGAGGMAEVFLAKTAGAEGIEKLLVIKRVLPSFARSPKFISMFVDEAKVAMRLNHPNIVQVYAFEQVKGEFLLAMEFVDGLDVGRLVSAARRRGRRLPPALCAYIVSEVSKGLDYAHNRKDESGAPMDIVHRDVSPQNVLLSYDGIVKVADFGIARARLVSEDTGVIKGKFSYMSPEQARGQRVDRRSDVYSLGVLLAELLMNRAMYPGQQGMEVLEQVREGRCTMPLSVDPSVPRELDEVVRRATSWDREERYQTSRSLAGALTRWLHMQDELLDAVELEHFVSDVAPREVTSPDGSSSSARVGGTADTHASLPNVRFRELRERRNVVVVHGRFRGDREEPITGVEPSGPSVDAAAVQVLEDIAYKYHAILDWPDGEGKRSFRLLIGLARVSVDDPLHATRLGQDMLDALDGLSADLLSPLTASIGLSRGVVATVRTGPGRRLRFQPVEGVFEVARQLGEHGAAGEILATGEVFRLARRAFSFDEQDVREITVTGTQAGPRRFRAYRLRGARTKEERASEAKAMVGQVGLFGRTQEIKAIVSAYEEVLETGRSAYLYVLGELGSGKSALVAAAIADLDPPATYVLHVECVFGGSEVPYGAVAELVREACGIGEDASPEEARKRLAKVLRKVLPADTRAADQEALEPLIAPTLSGSADVVDGSGALTRAVRHLLGGLAARGSCFVWVDALQFADAPSLELMARLMGQSYDSKLIVVLGSRADERVEEILGSVARIDLEELDEVERRALIIARFGGATVPPDIQQAIVHRAGGNPFFLIELVESLVDRGAVWIEGEGEERRVVRRSGAAFALPTTLEDVIATRLAELPEAERHTLRWLAVTGPGLRVDDLRVLTGESLDEELGGLERRGLVQRRPGGGLFFPSAVVRHVAYESIDSADRVRMHRMMSNYLTALALPVAPARLAHHREQAGDRTGAADAYLAAGRAAHQMHSNQEAMRFLGRVLALTEGTDTAFEAHEAREHILRAMGRRSERRNELEAMRALAERTRNPRHTAVAFSRLARFDLDAARPAGVDAMLRRALEASIEADDKGSEIEALRLYGQLRRDQGDTIGAIDALDRALARARTEERWLSARGETLVQKAILLWRAGQLDESLHCSADAVAIFRRLGLKAQEANALSSLGVALAHRGGFEDAITVIRASVALDRQAGDRLHLGRKISNIGQLYAELGDVEHAMGFLRKALEVFEAVADQSAQADALCAMGEILAVQVGDLDAAEGVLDDAIVIATRIQDPYDLAHVCLVKSCIHEAQDDHEGAAVEAKEALRHARTAGARGYEQLAMAQRAEALARVGSVDDARQLADELAERVKDRRDLERADHIHLRIAQAFALSGDADRADHALAQAREVVEGRLAQIRSETLRETYLGSPHVRTIRAGELGA